MRHSHSKIQQSLDPHSNQHNTTLQRLRHKLYSYNQTNDDVPGNFTNSNNNSSTGSGVPSPKTITISSANNIYQIESSQADELQLIMDNLRQFNLSLGGECKQPTYNLFNHVNCRTRRNNSSPAENVMLSFTACDFNHTLGITLTMLELLKSVASSCQTSMTEMKSISGNVTDSGYTALFHAILASLTIGSVLFFANQVHTVYTEANKEEEIKQSRPGYKLIPQS